MILNRIIVDSVLPGKLFISLPGWDCDHGCKVRASIPGNKKECTSCTLFFTFSTFPDFGEHIKFLRNLIVIKSQFIAIE